ncbi:hypothetical protein [Hamadaea tsunoensis]|uniref:hypothetical protein n=1 Tax=Hamadaea tsunoensis TaxID=53368 RepID=UPI0004836257|nr:hypothetical protein [Hamadaea tsunoensis]
MMRRFGDRATFAVELGETISPVLRVIDLWAAGKHMTTDDNVAFIPSFLRLIRPTATQVRQRDIPSCPFPGRSPEENYRLLHADETEFRERFWFMHWGETVDNLSCYAYLDEVLVIVFAFWRTTHPDLDDLGKIFVTKIEPEEFAVILQGAADAIEADSIRETT